MQEKISPGKLKIIILCTTNGVSKSEFSYPISFQIANPCCLVLFPALLPHSIFFCSVSLSLILLSLSSLDILAAITFDSCWSTAFIYKENRRIKRNEKKAGGKQLFFPLRRSKKCRKEVSTLACAKNVRNFIMASITIKLDVFENREKISWTCFSVAVLLWLSPRKRRNASQEMCQKTALIWQQLIIKLWEKSLGQSDSWCASKFVRKTFGTFRKKSNFFSYSNVRMKNMYFSLEIGRKSRLR